MKSIRKGQHGITSLNINGTIINNSKDKAEALNCQIQSVFTLEDLIHLPIGNGSIHPAIHDLSISVVGVLNLLKTLHTKKVPGPDNIPAHILEVCTEEIALI